MERQPPPIAERAGEYRFVPSGWESPFDHHRWAMIVDKDEIAKWREALEGSPPQMWYRDGKRAYSRTISYDCDKRPILVFIWGLR